MVEAALEGFETTRVPRSAAERIVLAIAHASEMTREGVVASALTSSGSSMEHLGSTMSAPLAQRLPTARPHILQSLPLLPSVVRGRDGLLRIGGTRPHESASRIDGFDVTTCHADVGDRPAERERERHGGGARSGVGHLQRRPRLDGVDRNDSRHRRVPRRRAGDSSRGLA